MKVETIVMTVPVYSVTEDEYGEILAVTQTGEETVTSVTLRADEGMCIVKKGENIPLGTKLTLGTKESTDCFGEMSTGC